MCMCVGGYLCVGVCTSEYVCVCIHVLICIHMCVCVFVCVCIYIYLWKEVLLMYVGRGGLFMCVGGLLLYGCICVEKGYLCVGVYMYGGGLSMGRCI